MVMIPLIVIRQNENVLFTEVTLTDLSSTRLLPHSMQSEL